jgi:antirestriction protein ArdC
MNQAEMRYGHQLNPALRREALAAYVLRYTAEHGPSWSRTPAPNGRHYAPQYLSDREWLDKTRFPITRSGQGIRLKSGSNNGNTTRNTIYCESNDPSWPYGQWLDRPFNRETPPQGNNGNDSNNNDRDHGPDGTVPPSSPQHPAPTSGSANDSTAVGTGTTQQLNPIPTENTMDKLELIELAQRFAPEGTTARVYNVKTDGDKPTDYKGTIVSIHEGQALQKLNERGSFVVHQADGLNVGDMVQITYDAGLRSIAPYAPSAALAADAHAATPGGNPKAAKAVKPKTARTPKAKAAKNDATPVTTATDVTADDVTSTSNAAEPAEEVKPAKTMEGITNDLYRQAAERIVAAIDAGTSIWQKPWKGAANGGRPHNAQSGMNYSGMNRVLLTFDMVDKETADARYMTYKQIQSMAREMAKSGTPEKDLPHVMKGAKGLPIYKMGFIEKKMPVLDSAGKPKLDADGKAVTRIVKGRSYLQSYIVFHASNIANLAPLPETEEKPQWERASAIEELIDQLGVPVKCEAQDRAYYSPSADTITMPLRNQFVDTLDENEAVLVLESARDKYYAVLLHEACHSTGHATRLGRDITGRPGDGSFAYEKEELIAETGSTFLTQSLLGVGANSESIKRTAAYLESWKSLILDDPKALFSAFSAAEKAADWVMQQHPIQLEAAAKLASETPGMAHTMDGVSPPVIAPIQTVESVRGDPMDPWTAPGVGKGHDPHAHAHSGFGMSQ